MDPEVVATAGLIHDLGNPPFGHAAEAHLHTLISDHYSEGFEGNAQSFRIITKLACHIPNVEGLNLTAATLNAVLKYPWEFDDRPNKNKSKYGVYREDRDAFIWARSLYPTLGQKKTLEANIMDLSDDITYAIHDLLDLWRSNFIPLLAYYQLFVNDENITDYVIKSFPDNLNTLPPLVKELLIELVDVQEDWAPTWQRNIEQIMSSVIAFLKFMNDLMIRPYGLYRGSQEDRNNLKKLESLLISRFFDNVRIDLSDKKTFLIVESPACDEIIILKALTRAFINNSPNLITQQYGEIKIIENIFNSFEEAVRKPSLRMILPVRTREQLEKRKIIKMSDDGCYRIIADAISSLSDTEALSLNNRLLGTKPGSIASIASQ